MKIAFIGQKGIPAIWGGIETHVEEIAARLAKRGHHVDVYVRDWYTPKDNIFYRNINLKHIFCIHTKYLDAITHSFNSSINALFNFYDIIHYQAMGPTLTSWIPKIFKKKVISTIHSFDYEAGKWGRLAKMVLRISEKFALTIPSKTIVIAQYLEDIYKSKGYKTVYIPNGVNILDYRKANIITKEYNLKGKDYILYMGRLVKEKRCDWLINAFKKLDSSGKNNLKLVIAGGSSSTDEYVKKLIKMGKKNKKLIFTNYVTGLKKEELLSNALLFILPSYLEGLPITILEASSYGVPCLVSDIIGHKELICEGVNGFFFLNDNYFNLESKLKEVLSYPDEKLQKIGMSAKENVVKKYNWDYIVDQTEKLYCEVLNSSSFK